MSKFKERLQFLKKSSGKTQTEIARDLGITPQALSYYMNGREPTFDILIKIAQYFDVTTDYLIGLADSPNQEQADFAYSAGLTDKAVKSLADNPLLVIFINYLSATEYNQKFISSLLDYISMSTCYLYDDCVLKASEMGAYVPQSTLYHALQTKIMRMNDPSISDRDSYNYYYTVSENTLFNTIRDISADIRQSSDFYSLWQEYYIPFLKQYEQKHSASDNQP